MRLLWEKFFDRPTEPSPPWVRVTTGCLLFLILTFGMWGVLFSASRNWEAIWRYRAVFWQGWVLTVGLSAGALIGSSLLGVAAAIGRRASFLPIRYLATGYVELIRGMPFLVLILLLFYGIPHVTQIGNRFLFGVAALSLFAGAYIAEMIRAGLDGIAATQWESARAIGLTPGQTYRYVVFPQVLRATLPPLTGQFASLIKDSSLLSVIGLGEFTHSAQDVFSATYAGIESYLPLGLGYLVLTLTLSRCSRWLEKKLQFES